MMLRTHLAITVFVILLFLSTVSNKFVFVIMALFACVIPDVDSGFSTIGRFKETSITRFFVKHRGILHSFSFCIIISILLAFFIPLVSLGFFVGYSSHLFADSFTIEGIKPFWPFKKSSSWRIRTGSLLETNVFIVFILCDVLLLLFYIISL